MSKTGTSNGTAAVIQAHYWGHSRSSRRKHEDISCLGVVGTAEGRRLGQNRLSSGLQALLHATRWRGAEDCTPNLPKPDAEVLCNPENVAKGPEAAQVNPDDLAKESCVAEAACPTIKPSVADIDRPKASSVTARPFSYRVRCTGRAALNLEVPAEETVGTFRSRIRQQLGDEPGITEATHVQLSYRDQQQGVVKLGSEVDDAFICDLIPDRSIINAQCVVGSDATQTVPRQANQQELQGLRTEFQMLLWEASRLKRELRGLSALAEKVYGNPQPDIRSLLNSDSDQEELASDECATALQERIAQLRAKNASLVRRHAQLEALVHRLSGKDEDYNRSWRGPTVCGRVHKMPADGSCLFHSLAQGITLAGNRTAPTAAALRNEVCNFLERRPNAIIAGKPLQEWILWESGENHVDYATKMRSEDKWGGPIEIAVCGITQGVNVHMYIEVASGSFQRMCNFDDAGKFANSVVNLVFRPGHYDALELADE